MNLSLTLKVLLIQIRLDYPGSDAARIETNTQTIACDTGRIARRLFHDVAVVDDRGQLVAKRHIDDDASGSRRGLRRSRAGGPAGERRTSDSSGMAARPPLEVVDNVLSAS